MKLLICFKCQDIFKLRTEEMRHCFCGESSGRYVDRENAVVSGPCASMAIGNGSLDRALMTLAVHGKNKSWSKGDFRDECSVICWVRPNTGPGNPRTTVLQGEGE